MKPLSSSGGRIAAFLAAGALAAGVWAQAGASPAPEVRAAEKPALQKTGPAKAERLPGDDGARAAIPPAIEIEIQRRINEIEKERLDDRAAYIDRWLAVVAIVLTFFGIVVAIVGLFGFKKFQQIEKEALGSAEEGKRHVEEAGKLVEEIKGYRDESQTILQNMNAENFAEMYKNDPEKARRAAEEVRENPRASLMDKAVAAALSFQKEGRKDEAIEKWRGIAKVAEGDDDDLAARAWFSIGYLFQEKGKPGEAIAAYDEALRLKPDLAEAYNNRGNAKSSLGQREAAIADYDEAIRLNPDYGTASFNRGLEYVVLNDKDAARRDFGKARDLARKAGEGELATRAESALKELDDPRGA